MRNTFFARLLVIIISVLLICSVVFTAGFGSSSLFGGLGGLGTLACLGCSGSSGRISYPDDSEGGSSETREIETSEPEDSSGISGYEEYDPEPFLEKCEQLKDAAEAGKSDDALALYLELYDEFCLIDENSSVLYINYSLNPSNEYLSSMYTADSQMYEDCADALLQAIKAVCLSPAGDEFREYVGDDYFEAFSGYGELTEEQSSINDRITELESEYYDAVSAEEAGGDEEAFIETAGQIFLELVELRTRLAESYGYDNYADFADAEIYCRDFTGDDIQGFCSSVKMLSERYWDLLYNSTAYFAPYYYIDDSMDTDEMLKNLTYYAGLISPLAASAADTLIEYDLYNIGSDSQRMAGSYTISLAKSGLSYIFSTTDNSLADFTALTHEFGHFTEDLTNENPNILLYSYGSLELSEIHSNGLEALYTIYYDNIFGGYSAAMEAYCVMDLLANVVEGCLYDEFQRTVYENPGMTLDEINSLYVSLSGEYGDPYADAYPYWWINISHNFDAPMYYFSYAASGLCALLIWLYSETSSEMAIELWEELITAGPYEYGYTELLEMLNVSDFTNRPTVIMVCEKALDFVESASFALTY